MSDPARKSVRFVVPVDTTHDLPDAARERARVAIEKLKRSYVEDWAPTSLNEIERVLKLAASQPHEMASHMEAAYRLAHDMKGQGATFGYELMSEIGAALAMLTHDRAEATKAEVRAMLAHVRAGRTVLALQLQDPEAPEALAVMAELRANVRANLH